MWHEKNDVQKYDVISFALEHEEEGRHQGEVVAIHMNHIIILNGNVYETYSIDEIIDLDHISYADRNEIYRH
jgi:hypothetical protein